MKRRRRPAQRAHGRRARSGLGLHPHLPAVVVVLASGTAGAAPGTIKLGHFAALRWLHGERELPEVFVGGEGLARGPVDVLGTLLHEAAHALAHVRGIPDTSAKAATTTAATPPSPASSASTSPSKASSAGPPPPSPTTPAPPTATSSTSSLPHSPSGAVPNSPAAAASDPTRTTRCRAPAAAAAASGLPRRPSPPAPSSAVCATRDSRSCRLTKAGRWRPGLTTELLVSVTDS
jgi:hypothetical protein